MDGKIPLKGRASAPTLSLHSRHMEVLQKCDSATHSKATLESSSGICISSQSGRDGVGRSQRTQQPLVPSGTLGTRAPEGLMCRI